MQPLDVTRATGADMVAQGAQEGKRTRAGPEDPMFEQRAEERPERGPKTGGW